MTDRWASEILGTSWYVYLLYFRLHSRSGSLELADVEAYSLGLVITYLCHLVEHA
jgi:hypothetical protein